MALRLGKHFQTSAQMWINLQSHYDLERAERNEWPYIKDRIRTMEIANQLEIFKEPRRVS